jgi:hypothetical protein
MKFGKLTKLIENVQKLDQRKIFVSIISDRGVQNYIISLNRTEQLFLDGETKDGDPLGQYSENTFKFFDHGTYYTADRYYVDDDGFINAEQVSQTVGAGDDYVMRDTGVFWDAFTVSVDDGGFTLSNNKTSKINLSGKKKGQKVDIDIKYGGLVGLNEKSKGELAQAIIPIIIRYVKNSLVDEIPRDLFI